MSNKVDPLKCGNKVGAKLITSHYLNLDPSNNEESSTQLQEVCFAQK